jgi:NAD-dependent dihydropyrimidine dehydrogenase PreA subunit/flavodoxin
MIFYFSATGNCKYVGSRIARNTNDEMVSIADCMKNERFSFSIQQKEAIGIISPTYSFGLPAIVIKFLENLILTADGKPYVYFVGTYGTTPGQIGYFSNQYMKKKGYPFDAQFSVKMPDTWTPIFDLSNKEKVSKINDAAESQIDFLIDKIVKTESGDFMKNKVPRFAAKLLYKFEYDNMRKTNHFIVEDTCISCGLCEKKCPDNAIKMCDGKPVWMKEQCVMCLGCLHRCPKFAIQYGKNTKRHGQYTNSNILI